jgi:hypothetical protein
MLAIREPDRRRADRAFCKIQLSAAAMAMLKRRVAIAPPLQWVRVICGFSAHQFVGKRLPTIEELSEVAHDTLAPTAGQFADLIVPDQDYFSCAEDEIADSTSELTLVGGKVVQGAGKFASFDEAELPPPPDWSPIRTFRGYAAWGDQSRASKTAAQHKLAMTCGCASACNIHGHDHAIAWSNKLPIEDLRSFWGALGGAWWAF